MPVAKGTVTFIREGAMIAHLDKDNKVIGIEIPPTTVSLSNFILSSVMPPHVGYTKCQKGFQNCMAEVTLSDIKYTVSCHYTPSGYMVDGVSIDEGTLNKSLSTYLGTKEKDSTCRAYSPANPDKVNTYDCNSCINIIMCETSEF